ncbi:putative F-box protein At3g25750 [Nicotiana sylvestris]|uniref:putative F-box protein At3g25750 n=1 Tax=Nicotiana sylvestris TaxID=4096 RepID=UPI00388C462F
MGRQKKKEKLVKPQQNVKNLVEPWPNLPQQLLNFIGRQNPNEPDRMQNISFRGVTKSWRAASKQCFANARLPCLELSHSKGYYQSKTQQEHTLNISFRPGEYWWYGRRPWDKPWTHFHGCSHGLIVAGGKNPADYNLMVPTAVTSYWTIPLWDTTIPFKFATLSSNPSKNYKDCSVMVLTGCSNPFFVVYQMGRQFKWIKQTNSLVDPNCSKRQLMILTNAIGFEGKFYALSLQGTLAVIEEVEYEFQVTKLSRSRAVPAVFSKHFTEYILESNGEILLIFLISKQSTKNVDKVEVYKLQMDDLSLVKVDNLGNRTIFVGSNSCMSVNASQLGCKSNCVYFNEDATNTWQFYEMESDTILPCFDEYGCQTRSPVWEEPIVENNCS